MKGPWGDVEHASPVAVDPRVVLLELEDALIDVERQLHDERYKRAMRTHVERLHCERMATRKRDDALIESLLIQVDLGERRHHEHIDDHLLLLRNSTRGANLPRTILAAD